MAVVEGQAKATGKSARTLNRWLADYEAEGLGGLMNRRPSNAGQTRVFVSRIFDQTFRDAGYQDELLGTIAGEVKAKAAELSEEQRRRLPRAHLTHRGGRNAGRAANLAKPRAPLEPPSAPPAVQAANDNAAIKDAFPCPCCGGRMRLIEVFERGAQPRLAPTFTARGIDSS